MKLKHFLSAAFLPLMATTVLGQDIPTSSLLSPNAASLGKYGELPVSYSTGTINISVPFHTFSEKGIELPIALQHDASGVKTNTFPSSVGQNWTLEAGGVISRITGGIYPDEYEYVKGDLDVSFTNYFHTYSELNSEKIDFSFFKDYAPDVFTFNFMGKTGKFFWDSKGQWRVNSEHNIQVIFDIEDEDNYDYPFVEKIPVGSTGGPYQAKTIKGFILKDDQGNSYKFGYNKDATEYSVDYMNQTKRQNSVANVSWLANSWYLTEVKDKHSNIIYSLDYRRGYFIAYLYKGMYYGLTKYKGSKMAWSIIGGRINSHSTGGNIGFPYSGDLIAPVYLRKITNQISGAAVHFTYKAGEHKMYPNILNNLILNNAATPVYTMGGFISGPCTELEHFEKYIYNKSGILADNHLERTRMEYLQNITLYDGNTYKVQYFDYSNDTGSRLFLTKLRTHKGAPNSSAYAYEFKYNNKDKLPGYLSDSTDHWGYFSGKNPVFPTADIEQYNFQSQANNFYNQKEPDALKTLYGTLSTIIYPTGGYSTITYEPHSYSSILSSNRQNMETKSGVAGGARIKEVKEYDSDNKILKSRKFHYSSTLNGSSSGQLAARPWYYWPDYQTTAINKDAMVTTYTFKNLSIIPLFNSSGSHVIYPEVIEEIPGNGYTKYSFTSYTETKDKLPELSFNAQPAPDTKYTEMGHRRGKLKSVKIYSSDHVIQKETTYSYRTDNPENSQYGLTATLTPHKGEATADYAYIAGGINRVNYSSYDVIQEINKDYIKGINPIVETKYYNKEDKILSIGDKEVGIRYLNSEQHIKTGNNLLKIEYKYPFDLAESSMSNLIDEFRIGSPIITSSFRNNIPIGVQKINYDILNSLIVPVSYEVSLRDNSQLETEITYCQYDGLGNVTRYLAKGKPSTVVMYGGESKRLVMAVVENRQAADIQHLFNPAEMYVKNQDRDKLISEFNRLRSMLPDCMITSYTYHGSNITSVTGPMGITTYYDYDVLGRLTETYVMENGVKKPVQSYEYNFEKK